MTPRSYPAKILLFGEYAIIRGSRALAIPYWDFNGRWAFSKNGWMCSELVNLSDYLEKLEKNGELLAPLDLLRFKIDLEKGMYFESTIPVGYGLGSSGALVAAFFKDYGTGGELPLPDLKKALAQIEGFFHGSSSGIDPLVCLLGKPLLLKEGGKLETVEVAEGESTDSLFLLDTGISRETGPLVRIFLSKCEDLSFDSRVEEVLGKLTNAAIKAYLSADRNTLFSHFGAISRFQWEYFQEMIPASFKGLWEESLGSENFHIKLCGAGGGGFLLVMALDPEAARKALAPHSLLVLAGSRKNL